MDNIITTCLCRLDLTLAFYELVSPLVITVPLTDSSGCVWSSRREVVARVLAAVQVFKPNSQFEALPQQKTFQLLPLEQPIASPATRPLRHTLLHWLTINLAE